MATRDVSDVGAPDPSAVTDPQPVLFRQYRLPLAGAQAQRSLVAEAGTQTPLLAGWQGGRLTRLTMRRCYERRAVPASLRAQLNTTSVDPAEWEAAMGLDGRDVLHRLHPNNLFDH